MKTVPSKCEMEVLKLLPLGLGNKEIAKILHKEVSTIAGQISSLLLRLDLDNRTQLAVYYVRNYEKQSETENKCLK